MDRTPLSGAGQLDRLHAAFMKMNASGVIFVAALNGSALGLGAEFAWACDLRVMADGDYFIGQPEVLLGIMPGGGGSQRLPRLIGTHKALVAILEGKPFTPAQALANGAVDDVVALDEVVTRATELAEYFGKRTKGSIEGIKRAVYFGGSMSLAEGLHVERTEFFPADQSEVGQQLMLQYLSDTEATGELPLYHPDTYAQALEWAGCPRSVRPTGRSGNGHCACLHSSRRLVLLRRGQLCRMALPAHWSYVAACGDPWARPRRHARDAP